MKKILVHINTFIMFVLTIIFILFIEFQIELRPNNIITNLEKLIYYQKAYSNVLQNLDDIIVNNKLKEELIEYYSIDILKKDVNFKNIMRKYIKILLFSTICIVISSLIEIYIVPNILKLLQI